MVDKLTPMDPGLRKKFLSISTATLATVLFRRGLRNQFIHGLMRLSNKPSVMVGPAFTLRYIPAREDLDVLATFRDPKHPQRLAVESVPAGHVLVMDCRGDASAASAGAILMTRLVVRSCAGVVTDGGLRDSDSIAALPIPVYCGARSAPTNLTKHHAIDVNLPIGCGGAPIFPGDILVGDGDGVMVVPAEIAGSVADEALQQEELEAFLQKEVAGGRALPGTYPPSEELLELYRQQRSGSQDTEASAEI